MKRRRLPVPRALLPCCTALLLLGVAPRAWGTPAAGVPAAEALEITRVELGFAGSYKLGRWTPVRVTFRGTQRADGLRLEAITEDGDGVSAGCITPEDALGISAGGEATAITYVKFGRLRPSLTLRVLDGDRVVAERKLGRQELPAPLLSTQPLVVELGETVGLAAAVRLSRSDPGKQIRLSRVETPEALPPDWYGYEGVDVLVAVTSRAGLLESLDDARFAALAQWLRLGGRILLCVGQRGEEVFAPGHRLREFAAGANPKVIALRTFSGLEDYARAAERLDAVPGSTVRDTGVPVTTFATWQGAVESSELGGGAGRIPTIFRTPLGLGQVTLLAFDADLPPFTEWQGRPALVARALQWNVGRRAADEDEARTRGQATNLGYEDLIGQLRGALDQFPGVTRIPFSLVAGLIAVYGLLIGPGEYLLLRKLGWQTWAWATFALLTIAFCGVAYALTVRAIGSAVVVNQAEVVDVDVQGGTIRGLSWAHVYSPRTAAFDFQLQPALPCAARGDGEASSLLSWQGLPGRGLGGLNNDTTVSVFEGSYRILLPLRGGLRRGEILRVPVPISGSKSLAGTWWAEAELPHDSQLAVDANGLLTGSLTHPLNVTLVDCSVVFDGWTYPLRGSVSPGQRVDLEGATPRNLEYQLTRKRIVGSRDLGTEWDPASLEVPRILEMLMFHGAAGDRGYTKMTHGFQPYLDLSDHLRCGRAMLVGKAVEPGTALVRNGAPAAGAGDQRWTVYRILYPVDLRPAVRQSPGDLKDG